MSRNDKLPETFVFLWQCCDLGEILPELNGITVYRRNEGFILENKEHMFYLLYPGFSMDLGRGQKLEVDRFFQPSY